MSLPSISKIASQKLQSFSFGHRTLSSRFNTSLSSGSSKIFAQSSKSLLYKNFSSTPELVAIENYPGDLSKFTTEKKFVNANPKIPTYRIMNEFGKVVDEKQLPDLDKETLVKMYTTMVKLNEMDKTLYNIQRQGRISFYMTSTGEEATHVGSAAALKPEDNIFAQYREAGVIMWRGFTIDEFMNQCYSNEKDYGKGRQMPVHYGSKALGIQTISSPLATQLPQAVGSAFAQKMSKANAITICYFGEGAASEGDAHAALNFAATLQAPVVFFCRNNRYAISTPSTEQFIGDGIEARGIAYGIDTIRVDGNDVFAVYNATVQARKMALEQNKPTLIEAMTYRIGHHSTSDDSSHYRQAAEIDLWRDQYNPITRLNRFLTDRGMWSEEKEKEFREAARKEVLDGLKKAETLKKPSIDELFNDVYDVIPPHLAEQKRQLEAHLAKYPDSYPLDHHAPSK